MQLSLFECTGKMIEYNKETHRYEKYQFTEVTPALDVEDAKDICLRFWASDSNVRRKVLRPKSVIKTMRPYMGTWDDPRFTKTFLEVVPPAKVKTRPVTTWLNDR